MYQNNIIPYSLHFKDYPMLVGDTQTQAVFEYMMDEYRWRLNKQKSTTDIPLVRNTIATMRNMDPRTVNKALKTLERTKLVSYDKNSYTININLFIELLRVFQNLTLEEKLGFKDSLQSGNIEELMKYGVNLEATNGKKYIASMSASSELWDEPTKMQDNTQKCSSTYKNAGQTTFLHDILQKCRATRKNVGEPTKMQIDLWYFATGIEQIQALFCKNVGNIAEMYAVNHPGFIPTLQAVGRYAKRIGFKRVTQRQNGKQVYFYIKSMNDGK